MPPVTQRESPARKRQRVDEDGSHRAGGPSQHRLESTPGVQEVESVDLTNVHDETELSKALSKQRRDAIRAQMQAAQGTESKRRTRLSSYKCPICMETPENATATICGRFADLCPRNLAGAALLTTILLQVTCFVTDAS